MCCNWKALTKHVCPVNLSFTLVLTKHEVEMGSPDD